MKKKALFIITSLPHAGATANETLDLLLVAAAFDLKPAVLFTGSGVHQLVPAQNSRALDARDVARAYQALPTYDVDQIFVDGRSLAAAGLDHEPLTLAPKRLTVAEVRALVANHDVVFTG
jgi:tRNA 2-thiouridine synthesizing protein C